MDKSLHDQISVIAQEVRDYTQLKADRTDYSPDDLNGWCAIASAEMFRRLTKKGISAELHMWNGDIGCHVFVVVEDHIVDVTATQFSEFRDKPIVVIHRKEADAYEFYESSVQFKSAEELRKYQKKNRWPNEQIAYAR